MGVCFVSLVVDFVQEVDANQKELMFFQKISIIQIIDLVWGKAMQVFVKLLFLTVLGFMCLSSPDNHLPRSIPLFLFLA
ncbi:hypothetical protein L6452_13002 [Arctium lappa]|uniref:Uncharacterized protein n=1 Tax=Arctium lappa TaxID=4217 RepID=A0ACB9CGY9_ARCLA|nr:hypothetical protein L6452_13002 [Arctium lappa]